MPLLLLKHFKFEFCNGFSNRVRVEKWRPRPFPKVVAVGKPLQKLNLKCLSKIKCMNMQSPSNSPTKYNLRLRYRQQRWEGGVRPSERLWLIAPAALRKALRVILAASSMPLDLVWRAQLHGAAAMRHVHSRGAGSRPENSSRTVLVDLRMVISRSFLNRQPSYLKQNSVQLGRQVECALVCVRRRQGARNAGTGPMRCRRACSVKIPVV